MTSRLALSLDPEDLRPLAVRATYYRATKRFDRARRDCEKYLARRPDDPRIQLLHGMILTEAGQEDKAVDAYRRAAALDEEDWVATNNLAMLLAERGEFDEALATAHHAYSRSDENVMVLDTVGFVALKAGQVKRAIDSLEQAVKLAPQHVDIQLHLAEAYGAGGRAREGRQLLAELKSRARGDRQVLAKIAEVQAGFP